MPQNAVPLERQIITIDLSKGLDERWRPELVPIAGGITSLENLVQDQTGAWVKRDGLVSAGVIDVSAAAHSAPKRVMRLLSGVGCVSNNGKFTHYKEAAGNWHSAVTNPTGFADVYQNKVFDYHLKSKFVSSSGSAGQSSATGAKVVSVASSSAYDAVLQDVGTNNYQLTVVERATGVTHSYTMGMVPNTTNSGMMAFVGDRYLHVYLCNGTSLVPGTLYAAVVDTNSLPSTVSGFAVATVASGAVEMILRDVVASSTVADTCFVTTYADFAGSVYAINNSAATTDSAAADGTSIDVDAIGNLWLLSSPGATPSLEGRSQASLTTVTYVLTPTAAGGDQIASDPSGNLMMTRYTTATFGAGTIPALEMRMVPAGFLGLGTLRGSIYGWGLVSKPFWCAGDSKFCAHLVKQDTTTELSCHIIADLTFVGAIGGGTYGSVRVAAVIEPFNGLQKTGIIIGDTSFGIFRYQQSGNDLSACVPFQTAARTAGIAIARLRFQDVSAFGCASFSGSTYIAHGGLCSYDGKKLVEQGFVDQPTTTKQTLAVAGNLNGSYKYVTVYRYVDVNGTSAYSRTYGPISATNVAAGSGKNTITVQPCCATNRDGGNAFGQVIVDLYRTVSGGTTYFLVASSAPGVGVSAQLSQSAVTGLFSVTDNISDTILAANAVMYRQPGTPNAAVDRYPAPASGVVCQHKDRLFCLDPYGQRVYYSSFFVDGEAAWFNPLFNFYIHAGSGPLVALASMDGRLFAFKRDAIFVIDGDGPPEGGPSGNEYSPPQRLASTYGCIDARSVVETPEGIIYRSARGIEIITRSLQVKWLGDRVQDTVAAYPVTTGACIDRWGRVRVTLAASESASGSGGVNGVELVYDYPADCWSVMKHTGASTAYGAAHQSIAAVTVAGAERVVYADDVSGVYFNSATDSLDVAAYVPFKIESGWMKQGPQTRQMIHRILFLAKKQAAANHAIKVSLAYDYVDAYTQIHVWEPDEINSLTVEELELPATTPESLSVRIKVEDQAPADVGTYPVGDGRGCDVLGLAADIALKSGVPFGNRGGTSYVPPYIAGVGPASATYLGLDPMTIYGKGFTGITDIVLVSAVTGYTVHVSPTVVDDGIITFVSPAGVIGAVDLSVVGPGGTVTKTSAFSYV